MGKNKNIKNSHKNKKVSMDDSSDSQLYERKRTKVYQPRKARKPTTQDSSVEPVSSYSLSGSGTSLSLLSYSDSKDMSSTGYGKNRRRSKRYVKGPNSQQPKVPQKGPKGQKKEKKSSGSISTLLEDAVFDAEKKDLSEQLKDWYYKQKIAEDAENQFPTLTRVRVEAEPNFDSFIRAMAVYPAYAMAKRSISPASTITLSGGQVVGRLWLAWATFCFDVWTRCIPGGGVSLFEDAHPHYRRFWHMVKPQVRGEFMYLWTPIEDFFTLFNNNLLGPTPNFLLTWTIGNNDPATGRRQLVNIVPMVTEQILRKEGLECAKEVFQNCLGEGWGLSPMTKEPKYQGNCSPAAFANKSSDNSGEIVLSATYELELKFRLSDLDIAQLDLAVPRPGRVCIHKQGRISGCGDFFLKLIHPQLFKEWTTALQKEFPVTQYFCALLAQVVPATRMLEEDMDLSNVTMSATNYFNNMSMGQFLTAGLLDACQRMILGNSISQLNGCYSGSTVIGGDVRGFIDITKYGEASTLALREGMKLISMHAVAQNAITRRSPVGKEWYIPCLTTRGAQFGGNPLMVSDVPTFNNFVQSIYSQATVGGWEFDTLPLPAIPNFIDTLDITNMYFQGPTVSAALKQMNVIYGALQANLGTSTLTDTKIGDATLMYFSRVITKPQVGVWDTTMLSSITQVSNRFPLSNATLGAMPSLTPVFYADEIDPTTWFSVYGEYCSLLGDVSDTFNDQVLRVFVLFAHQRATWGGYGNNEFYIAQVYQGLGGGFFYALSNAVTGILKTAGTVGRFVSGIHDTVDALTQRKLDTACTEFTSKPHIYGANGMMELQKGGHLDQLLMG